MKLSEAYSHRHPSVVAVLRFFDSEHLEPEPAVVSHRCTNLARAMLEIFGDDDPELTWGLRQLLLAKDAFVRLAVAKYRPVPTFGGPVPTPTDPTTPTPVPPKLAIHQLPPGMTQYLTAGPQVAPRQFEYPMGGVRYEPVFDSDGGLTGYSPLPPAQPSEAPAVPPGGPSEAPEPGPTAEATPTAAEPAQPAPEEQP